MIPDDRSSFVVPWLLVADGQDSRQGVVVADGALLWPAFHSDPLLGRCCKDLATLGEVGGSWEGGFVNCDGAGDGDGDPEGDRGNWVIHVSIVLAESRARYEVYVCMGLCERGHWLAIPTVVWGRTGAASVATARAATARMVMMNCILNCILNGG